MATLATPLSSTSRADLGPGLVGAAARDAAQNRPITGLLYSPKQPKQIAFQPHPTTPNPTLEPRRLQPAPTSPRPRLRERRGPSATALLWSTPMFSTSALAWLRGWCQRAPRCPPSLWDCDCEVRSRRGDVTVVGCSTCRSAPPAPPAPDSPSAARLSQLPTAPGAPAFLLLVLVLLAA